MLRRVNQALVCCAIVVLSGCDWTVPPSAEALRHAVAIKDHRTVEEILRVRPELAKRELDPDIGTALNLAVETGDEAMVRLILKYPCDVNRAAQSSGTPLYDAAYFGRKEIATMLLDAGADVNLAVRVRNASGTPLQSAAKAGQYELVVLLVERGADVNGVDPTGRRLPPLIRAIAGSPYKEWPEHKKIVEYLLAHGAKIPSRDTLGMDGQSALEWAKLYGTRADTVELLKAHGASE